MTLPREGVCIVDERTAIMDPIYFRALAEYSMSIPTGTYIGKRWKRSCGGDQWLMGEYSYCGSATEIKIRWRDLIVIE